jgi:hypothetical protein
MSVTNQCGRTTENLLVSVPWKYTMVVTKRFLRGIKTQGLARTKLHEGFERVLFFCCLQQGAMNGIILQFKVTPKAFVSKLPVFRKIITKFAGVSKAHGPSRSPSVKGFNRVLLLFKSVTTAR